MNRRYRHSPESHPERGAVLVLVAISMVALIGVVALAVDLGYLMVTRNEVQNIADGAALAGARKLGAMYQALPYTQQQVFYCGGDCQAEIRAVAQQVAGKNRAGGRSISELDDVFIGRWREDQFTEDPHRPNAVRVIARRDEAENGRVSTFFARTLGIDEVAVNADAVAAMTGQGQTHEGELNVPVTLDSWFFAPGLDRCNDYIKFYPTGEGAGWTSFFANNASRTQLSAILAEGYVSPAVNTGDDIRVTSGVQATTLTDFLIAFQREGCASTDGNPATREPLGGEGACIGWQEALEVGSGAISYEPNGVETYYPEWSPPHKDDPGAKRFYHLWEVTVPIFEDPHHELGPPTGWLEVVGFATVKITDVILPADPSLPKQILGVVLCDVVSPENNRGGGGEYGTFGPIPGLVR